MCSKRRLKSVCASAQSDQSLRCQHVIVFCLSVIMYVLCFQRQPYICILGYPKCDQWRFWSDCTMRRLIWILSGRIYLKVRFLILRLIDFRAIENNRTYILLKFGISSDHAPYRSYAEQDRRFAKVSSGENKLINLRWESIKVIPYRSMTNA